MLRNLFRTSIFFLTAFLIPHCKPKANNQQVSLTDDSIPFQNSKFILITSRNGLNLRLEPSVKSRKILTIPYGSMLPVKEVNKQFETIQKRNGYWLKTEYTGKTGWVFSGFVIFGETIDGLKAYKLSMEEPPSLPPPAEFIPLVADDEKISDFIRTKKGQHKIGNWTLTEYDYKNTPDSYDCLATMAGIKFTSPGIVPIELQAREVIKLNSQFPNVVPVYSDLGGCSCKQVKFLSLYFQMEAKLMAIQISMPLHQEGSCGEGGGNNIDTRYDKATDTIIQQKKAPNCAWFMVKDKAEAEKFGTGDAQFAGWAYTQYTIVEGLSSGAPKLRTIQTLASDLSQIWDRGLALNSTPEY